MLLYPSVDKLLDQIDSRYSLIALASKRAHELDSGANPLLDSYKSQKSVGKALEEISAGVLKIDPKEKDFD
ncbi:DNA-directed RNA polymerase subunit omega [Lentilactobacillus parabuchneri]|uniref:DNA-directed RNA polymerase subunit omega n=1 Tax=Lentilactobacillus parabuchneri TaxID=152331 RepID=UPI000A10EF84|nr:DNA-directed RNA polymerase subunit omega [Lentilactobacillus parabuchneri]ORN06869.1 DNA-directed RNA polymerase subunit omega [Lentilactobacillus parabuchneri]ORN21153.1 DNA-directed RNA polymerase subunit omega [Lentilactobacillus parabuchneri]